MAPLQEETSVTDLQQFERSIKRQLDQFLNPTPSPRKPQVNVTKGLTVTLAVRKKRLSPDIPFVFHTTSISRLDARLQAERAARQAGWNQIGYVISYT